MPSFERLLHEIRGRIDYESLFGEFVELRGSGPERHAFCVFHANTNTPAMSVNIEDGLYHCHNPECAAQGDFVDFYRRVRNQSFSEAVRELARRVGLNPELYDEIRREAREDPGSLDARNEALLSGFRVQSQSRERAVAESVDDPVVDVAIALSAHERLLNTPTMLEFLTERRGLTRETIVEYQLGHDGDRYFIPVYDAEQRLVNIRRYKPNARRAQDKMISWRTGFGRARLYPARAFEEPIGEPLVLLEGEMDCLLGRQLGLNAVTTTGGAGTWRSEWNERFRGRDVVICYDCDEAGRAGSRHIAGQLHGIAQRIKVIALPLAEPEGADFTDFIVGHGHSIEDFRALVRDTTEWGAENEVPPAPPRDPILVHLSDASRAEYNEEPVTFEVRVSGKTTAPYLIPKRVEMNCGTHAGRYKMCERCPLMGQGGRKTVEVDGRGALRMIDVSEEAVKRHLKELTGIPARCGYVEQNVIEAMNVEVLQVIPEVDRSDSPAPYVTRMIHYIGHGVKTNVGYRMTGITVPEPKKQMVTHLIHSAVPAQSNIETFRLTDDVVERLRQFQPSEEGVTALGEKLDSIYDDLERRIRIYERRDVLLGVDLTFHSAIGFTFQGERLVRGWMECLLIGDSRTGKTTIVERLIDHYGAGEMASGENTSLAGLMGGLHQIGTTWALQWGKVPLNDRRLLVIDEAGNLPTEHIARMSSMRSSGIAEIVKVHTERTNARTRQIWISNPRSPRPLSSFSQGVIAVKELVGAPEDIARFDVVLTAAAADVPLHIINSTRVLEEPRIFTSELCHQRVMWAWSRSSDQIAFQPRAVQAVLELAQTQGEKYRYTTEIPLVEPNEQRVKLARMSVAAAALFFSTIEGDATKILVRPEHVEFSYNFLERAYAKPSLAFDEYADQQARRFEVTDEERVRGILAREAGAARALMEQEQMTQRDLQEILGYDDRGGLRSAVAVLRDAGFLRRQGSSFYVKTSGAVAWLRRYIAAHEGRSTGSVASWNEELATTNGRRDDPPW
jgi:hypothetical protein